MNTIDLRSDTVTKPTKAMLEAMFSAEVGDDVFGEDPTVRKLEEKCALMFGAEAGLFAPSGTMTNQIALRTHTLPGEEVICDATAHIYHFEGGGLARNSFCQHRLINGENGKITPRQIEDNINLEADWYAKTSLVSIENTGNKSGGTFYTYPEIKAISETCKKHRLQLFLDGARIFNALTETKESPRELGKLVDSLTITLSKGLGAPVGSVLMGSREFIKNARKVRKNFGGGMRQAGYLAAAGIFALDHHVERLKDDHARARIIGKELDNLPFVETLFPVYTNIVVFKLRDNFPLDNFMKQLNENNIKASLLGRQLGRFVTHLDITDAMVEKVCDVLKKMGKTVAA